mgnify:CR=1 FL=1
MVYKIHIWRLVLVPLALCVAAFTADLRGQDTISYYRFEEGGGTDIVDDVSGDTHGAAESVVYSRNVPLPTVDGKENVFSLEARLGLAEW